jgi:predicted GIY-YIG superfamily endonuclease
VKVSIYVLRDPRSLAVRYVGKTVDTEQRLRHHLRADSGRAKSEWVRALGVQGLAPVMQTVEVCGEDWPQRERRWIKRLRDRGIPLVNATHGGCGKSYARRHWIDKGGRTRFYDEAS